MNFIPLIIALVVVLVYIAALKLFGQPPSAQTTTMLNLIIGLILLALVLAAFWPLIARVER